MAQNCQHGVWLRVRNSSAPPVPARSATAPSQACLQRTSRTKSPPDRLHQEQSKYRVQRDKQVQSHQTQSSYCSFRSTWARSHVWLCPRRAQPCLEHGSCPAQKGWDLEAPFDQWSKCVKQYKDPRSQRAAWQSGDNVVQAHAVTEQSRGARCAVQPHAGTQTWVHHLLVSFDFFWKETKAQGGRKPQHAPRSAAVWMGRGPRSRGLPKSLRSLQCSHNHMDLVLFQGILLFHQLLLLRSETETQYVISWISAKLTSSHILTEETKGSV